MKVNIFYSCGALLASTFLLFGWVAGASDDLSAALLALSPAFLGSIATIALFVALWRKSDGIPLFDLGIYMSLAILLYLAIPVFQFVLSGFQHTVFSARQLYEYSPSVTQFTTFAYSYAFYLVSFVSAYLIKHKAGKSFGVMQPSAPRKINLISICFLYLCFQIFCSGIELTFGTSKSVSYDVKALYDSYQNYLNMPSGLKQLYGHIVGMLFIAKIALIVAVYSNWHKKIYRTSFIIWLLFEVVFYYFQSGSRTELILTLFLCGVLYIKFVREVSLTSALVGGAIILILFVAMGVLREGGNIHERLRSLDVVSEYQGVAFSVANEFQTLFGGAYDLTQMVASGALKDVPLQLNFYELMMLIPQQFVPFEKIDVANWYLTASSTGGFFMLNPVAQGAIGLGVVEIVIRGGLLGYTFAAFTNYFYRNSQKFWVFVFYAWMITQCYYSIRSSSFYFLAFVSYRFIPLLILFILLKSFLLSCFSFSARRAIQSSQ